MVELGAVALGVEVHEHADRSAACRRRCRAPGRRSAARHRARARRAAVAGNWRVEVVGGGEDDADEVLVVDVVALEHLADQPLGLRVDLARRCPRRRWSRPGAPGVSSGAAGYARVTLSPPRPVALGLAGRRVERAAPRPARQRAPLARAASRGRAAGRSGCAPGAAPDGRPPRTCAAPGGCGPRGCTISTRPTSRAARRPSRRRGHAVVELDALAQAPERARRRHALDLGEVLLLHAEARMGEPVGELAVVGEEQQALGVAVEPADGEHPRLVRAPGRRRSAGPAGSVAVVTTPAGLFSR